MRNILTLLALLSSVVICVNLRIEQLMTADEMRETGVSTLAPAQKEALTRWLNVYTLRVVSIARRTETQDSRISTVRTSCNPAIESTISGKIEGWDGDTIFRLDNGQIWQQAEYDYTYFYDYRPDVTIYSTTSGCRMKVEGESETVLVKRIK